MTLQSTSRLETVDVLTIVAWMSLVSAAFLLPFLPLIPGLDFLLPGLLPWDRQRVFQGVVLLIGLVCLGGLVSYLQGSWQFVSRPVALSWILVSLLSLLSALLAERVGEALLDWAWMQALVLLVILSAGLFGRVGQSSRVWIIGCTGAVSLLYVSWYFLHNADYLFSYDFRFMEPTVVGFTNPRYFSDFQAVLLFLAPLACACFLAESRLYWVGWVLVGLLFALAFQIGSRSVLLGQVVAHFVLFCLLGKRYWPNFRLSALSWGLGLTLYIAIFQVYAPWSQSLGNPDRQSTPSVALAPTVMEAARVDSSGRGELLTKAWRLIRAHPVLGVGGRHYGCFIKADFHDPHNRFNSDAAHPHNAPVQIAAEWGVGVMLLAVGGVVWLLHGIGQSLRNRTRDESVGVGSFDSAMAGCLLALLSHSMVTGVMNAPVSQMLMVLLFGWGVWFAYANRVLKPIRLVPSVLIGIVAAVACLLIILTAKELVNLPAANAGYFKNNPPTWNLMPRFWQQGWLLPLCGTI